MIEITMRDNEYSYDLKTLAMAFYPEQPCVVKQEADASPVEDYRIRWKIGDMAPCEERIPAPYTKNEVRRRAYRFLSGVSGKTLPWGVLTGVRPAKIVLRMLLAGRGKDETLRWMQEEYLCTPEKAALAVDVAWKEAKLIKGMNHAGSVSIYIGIPFCPSICSYCSFSSFPIGKYEKKVDDYLNALEREMKFAGGQIRGKMLQTVYIGGGTPTSLDENRLERLLVMTEKYFPVQEAKEVTVEAGRPDSITEGKLKIMKDHGVTRISINPQSMKQRTLELLGRRHTPEDIQRVFRLARQMGFDNINMDVIAGLPEESCEDFRHTLSAVEELKPDSITVHTLVIKRASRMRREQMERGAGIQEENPWISTMQSDAERFCRERGYEPYYMYRQKNKAATTRNTNQENVAYAKPGKECLYNVLMMEELQTILALGSGGSSKYIFPEEDRMERVENVKSVEDYILRIDEMIQRKQNMIKKEEKR